MALQRSYWSVPSGETRPIAFSVVESDPNRHNWLPCSPPLALALIDVVQRLVVRRLLGLLEGRSVLRPTVATGAVGGGLNLTTTELERVVRAVSLRPRRLRITHRD